MFLAWPTIFAALQIVYYDGQFDDARLNVTLACTAALAGATVLNHTKCTQLLKVRQCSRTLAVCCLSSSLIMLLKASQEQALRMMFRLCRTMQGRSLGQRCTTSWRTSHFRCKTTCSSSSAGCVLEESMQLHR